jgi:hypothetical protein
MLGQKSTSNLAEWGKMVSGISKGKLATTAYQITHHIQDCSLNIHHTVTLNSDVPYIHTYKFVTQVLKNSPV